MSSMVEETENSDIGVSFEEQLPKCILEICNAVHEILELTVVQQLAVEKCFSIPPSLEKRPMSR